MAAKADFSAVKASARLDIPAWRVRTPQERRASDFEKWVARLVDVRNEKERRQQQIGGINEYIRLLGTPEADRPWKDRVS